MKKIFILIPILCLIIIAALYGWSSLAQRQKPRGIILVSIDTLRADHLGVYGYRRDTSPSIDAFANESIVFDRAVVQSPLTLPSHISIMTSLYPFSHGILSNNNRLADEQVTLAELLREKGYKTAGFADGLFLKGSYGFEQGFDIYDSDKRIGIARILPKALQWLEENKSSPFFLFIHCYDVHDPYIPPPPYNTIFHDFAYTGTFVPNNRNLKDASWEKLAVTDEDLQHIVALYDGGIRYTDAKMGEFLSYLQEAGLKDSTLIIITSDHGEEFKEHGSFLHWQLYCRPNLHVPLIINLPGVSRKTVRVEELVQSIDILPTILDIAQIEPHSGAQGRSLVPLIEQNSTFPGRIRWRMLRAFGSDDNSPVAVAATRFRKQQYSIISGDYQLIYKMASPPELFDLSNDPLAQNDIAAHHEARVLQLVSKLSQIKNAHPRYKASTFVLDQETRQQLETLGYVDE